MKLSNPINYSSPGYRIPPQKPYSPPVNYSHRPPQPQNNIRNNQRMISSSARRVPIQFSYQMKKNKEVMRSSEARSNLFSFSNVDMMNMQKCRLCEQRVEGQKCRQMGRCEHTFCQDCLIQYAIYKININEEVLCPEEECKAKMEKNSLIYNKLPETTQRRFDQQALWRQTINNPNVKVCPYQNCRDGMVDLTKQPPQCHKCGRRYCRECMMEAHPGRQCDQNFQNYFQDLKRCPNCKMFIQKVIGCNHIVCLCRYQFCYVCLVRWENYHYNCIEGAANERPMDGRVDYVNVRQRQHFQDCPASGLIMLILLIPVLLAIMIALNIAYFVVCMVVGMIGGYWPLVPFKDSPWAFCIITIVFYPFWMVVGIFYFAIGKFIVDAIPYNLFKINQYIECITQAYRHT